MSLDSLEIFNIADTEGPELQRLFSEKGWGDGLPLIAPTT